MPALCFLLLRWRLPNVMPSTPYYTVRHTVLSVFSQTQELPTNISGSVQGSFSLSALCKVVVVTVQPAFKYRAAVTQWQSTKLLAQNSNGLGQDATSECSSVTVLCCAVCSSNLSSSLGCLSLWIAQSYAMHIELVVLRTPCIIYWRIAS